MSETSQLAEVLVEGGLIDQEQVVNYRRRAESEGRHPVELMIEDGVCGDDEIAQAVSVQRGLPYIRLTQLRIPGYVAKILPRELADEFHLIPVSVKKEGGEEVLYVAFFDPTNEESIVQIEAEAGKPVRRTVAALRDITYAIKRYYKPLGKSKPKGKRNWESGQTDTAPSRTKTPPKDNLAVAEMEPMLELEEENISDIEEMDVSDVAEVDPDIDFGEARDASSGAMPALELDEDDDSIPLADVDSVEEAPKPKIDVDDLDIDLGLDDDMLEVEPEALDAPKAAAASAPESDDFADFDADFDDDMDVDFDEPDVLATAESPDPNAESDEHQSDVDFLSFDDSKLQRRDDDILRKQQEAEKVKQDRAFGADFDLDFEESAEESETLFAGDEAKDSDADFLADDLPGDGDDSRAAPLDKVTDEEFDLEFGEAEVSVDESKAATDASQLLEAVAGDDDAEDFEFDFDIPEAPEFDPNASGSHPVVQTHEERAETYGNFGDEAPETDENDAATSKSGADWSLDIDSLLEGIAQEPETPPEAIADASFEEAAAELDAFLAESEDAELPDDGDMSATTNAGAGTLDAGVLEQLVRMSENPEEPTSDEDVRFIYDFLNGQLTNTNDPKVKKLGNVLAALTKTMVDKGLIEEPDLLMEFFKREGAK